ncbi:cysteine methyltransferase [Thiocapsa imhoffii]|uniref:methylated-DNA--[protein]-cysteine S-methyltransferase n=1 Tax=Thiocapsa imhoffii TaxID=382777 RepID=A0A9X1B8L8_9GAMM|nr:methylated-DNA--[protein]-cysteine S-methyltransferase [Thiocapsa imhoffii]MBK1644106.1 cysteine methyltransferase [Thiocapsa imhoffii]
MSSALVETPCGPLGVVWDRDLVTRIELDPTPAFMQDATGPRPDWLLQPILNYFERPCARLELPVHVQGTAFQQRVWAELRQIPCGQTRTYGAIARQLGTSPRAVGQACRANPCPLVIPCHRVVAVSGLGGFAGDLHGRKLAMKRWLLKHEGVVLDGSLVADRPGSRDDRSRGGP